MSITLIFELSDRHHTTLILFFFCSLSCTRSDNVCDPVQHGSSELLSSQVWCSGDGFSVCGGQHGSNDPDGHTCPGETRRRCRVCPLPAFVRSTSSTKRYGSLLKARRTTSLLLVLTRTPSNPGLCQYFQFNSSNINVFAETAHVCFWSQLISLDLVEL